MRMQVISSVFTTTALSRLVTPSLKVVTEVRYSKLRTELFRRIRLKDPLKQKRYLKVWFSYLKSAVQVPSTAMATFMVGAVGVLQFDVVVARLVNTTLKRSTRR